MICSRYFSEIPCLAAISFTLIHSPLLFNARSSMTRTAYLPLVEIFILSSFPSILLLCFTFHISLLIPKQFKTAPIFLWFPQILPYFFLYFSFSYSSYRICGNNRKIWRASTRMLFGKISSHSSECSPDFRITLLALHLTCKG